MLPASCIRSRGRKIRVAWHWPPTGGDKVQALDHLPVLCPRRRSSPEAPNRSPPDCPLGSLSTDQPFVTTMRAFFVWRSPSVGEALAPAQPNNAAEVPATRISATVFLTPSPLLARSVFGGDSRLRLALLRACQRFLLRDTARAMSQENVEVIKRGADAWTRQDADAFLATLDPDVEWEDAMFWSEPMRVYRGRQ